MESWIYILWDRIGPSMHGGYPCTVDIHGQVGIHYRIWDRLGPSMHVGYPYCTDGDIYGRGGYLCIWIG
jgi:hypothetical protein